MKKLQTINHRENFLRGVRAVLKQRTRRKYHIPKRGDTARDADAMREDFATVGRDLKYATNHYGKGK